MNTLIKWLEKTVVPVAAKIGSIRWLVALRDAFITTMPATMAGSIAVLLNALLRDIPTQAGWTGFVSAMQPIIGVNGQVWTATLAVYGLIFAFTWGYNLAKQYAVDPLAGGIVTLGAFLMGLSQSAAATLTLGNALGGKAAAELTKAGAVIADKTVTINAWGYFNFGAQFGSGGLFTAMILGAIAATVYIWFMKKKITIKMPDSVPAAVANAFTAIIPALVGLYVVGILTYAWTQVFNGEVFIDWVNKTIQGPLLHLSQGYGAVLLLTLLVQLFWFFGIHGTNVLGPVLDSIWLTAQLDNINRFQQGEAVQYLWTRSAFDMYAWIGGAGSTLLLLIAIFIFSKRADERAVAKLAIAPGIFQINEPVMFGLPIVLSPIYFIPFILAPVVMVTIAYWVIQFGWVSPIKVQTVWVMPPFINSFLATGFDWRAPVLQLVNMVVGFFIWAPFVIAANKIQPDQLEGGQA
ncbi:PTS sugar transporter subunit IIC [Lacticaseibacillus nasuensis]|jgi:PTS system cellobiose-specific IIC component|uniref:Permease IIC component n=1 Tax=Lacticaseibacillus nasuensis JCM 17158 TaxID=1291734 RepID=A0A0R1JSX5_9LACO|nr:PTS sugar transporter subunit IIC [Lacticaseibacillus nasuensis]KRK71769.1 pts system cellobiose-specific transporter subunit iic [Lacticaseibacillus nasuensis JCM 17158]MCX2455496.1 PTS sugar transporter subunit IIC [Lacticaseibacillus nasuensis]